MLDEPTKAALRKLGVTDEMLKELEQATKAIQDGITPSGWMEKHKWESEQMPVVTFVQWLQSLRPVLNVLIKTSTNETARGTGERALAAIEARLARADVGISQEKLSDVSDLFRATRILLGRLAARPQTADDASSIGATIEAIGHHIVADRPDPPPPFAMPTDRRPLPEVLR